MKFWGNSDTGMVRSENQDTYLMASLPRGAELLLVCDGMGGAQGGKVASTIACSAFEEEARRLLQKEEGEQPPLSDVVTGAAQAANRVMELLGRGGSEYELLAALEPVSRQRDDLLELCVTLRQKLTAELYRAASGQESVFSARQLTFSLEALEDLIPRVEQNGNVLLLSTLLASRLRAPSRA